MIELGDSISLERNAMKAGALIISSGKAAGRGSGSSSSIYPLKMIDASVRFGKIQGIVAALGLEEDQPMNTACCLSR